jgi:hypothetical protein
MMATIHRLQRSPIDSLGSKAEFNDSAPRRPVEKGWQCDHYADALAEILARIQRMPRTALVQLTARLIDHLDQSDVDFDTEDDDPDHEHDGREPDDYR